MKELRHAYKIFIGKPERKKPLGRGQIRCNDKLRNVIE
jgi:hypothetical protein